MHNWLSVMINIPRFIKYLSEGDLGIAGKSAFQIMHGACNYWSCLSTRNTMRDGLYSRVKKGTFGGNRLFRTITLRIGIIII